MKEQYTYKEMMHEVPGSAKVVHPLKQIELVVLESFHRHEHWGSLLAQIMSYTMTPAERIKL